MRYSDRLATKTEWTQLRQMRHLIEKMREGWR